MSRSRTLRAVSTALIAAQLCGCATAPLGSMSNHEICEEFTAAPLGTSRFQAALFHYRARDLDAGKCAELADAHKTNNTLGILGAIAIGALVIGAARKGGGGGMPQPVTAVDVDWDWDQFRAANGQLVWMCRGIQTGQFAPDERCFAKAKLDLRWPGLNFR